MRSRLVVAAIVVVAPFLGVAAPASAQTVTVCHDAHVAVQGDALVDEEGCTVLPPEDGGGEA